MAKVRFYGDLKRFGSEFKLEVETGAEALRALLIQIPGLRQHISQGRYKVRVGEKQLDMDTLDKGMHARLKRKTEIRITPVVAGAKNGGLFQTILGAALVVIGAIGTFTPFGQALGGAAWGPYAMQIGGAMMLGGVAQMLAKTPKTSSSSSADNGAANNYFSSLENVVGQGDPVPLLYGRMRVGSHVISQGLITDVTSS
ncbi:tail assembly protein [Sodalis ligni]|uniref:tail assembly protein n=1 Tax=Sodalis ligni TaxID=2697027 RepID=UPI00193FA8B3|nr:tail assembly protein [Sodalis ligni]QWA09511.1 tail assembly protein [Sodalis ligni]